MDVLTILPHSNTLFLLFVVYKHMFIWCQQTNASSRDAGSCVSRSDSKTLSNMTNQDMFPVCRVAVGKCFHEVHQFSRINSYGCSKTFKLQLNLYCAWHMNSLHDAMFLINCSNYFALFLCHRNVKVRTSEHKKSIIFSSLMHGVDKQNIFCHFKRISPKSIAGEKSSSIIICANMNINS